MPPIFPERLRHIMRYFSTSQPHFEPDMSESIRTRILIISDTHGRPLQDQNEAKVPFRQPLPDADVLIHCGDMTMVGSHDDYHATLDVMKQVPASLKLVIAGNHDLTLDKEWMSTHEGDSRARHPPDNAYMASREFWTGNEGRAKKEGIVFLDEGVHSFKLQSGAKLTVYASPYTPEFYDWGFPYKREEDRFNQAEHSLEDATNICSNPVPSFEDEQSIDIMVTHGPPFKRLDTTCTGKSAGCHHLLRALMRARPLVHCFGHIHEGWGAEVIHWADHAKDIATKQETQIEWSDDGWKQGVKRDGIVGVKANLKKVSKDRGLHVDVIGKGFERGKQTLVANASIVDVKYAAINAPMIVDVGLRRA